MSDKGNRIYCAGPMTGYKDKNFPAFNKAAEELRELGWEVINPVDINPDPEADWHECMRKDIAELVTCDAIFMLNGWADSSGATKEHTIAEWLEMDIYYEGVDYTEEGTDAE